MAPGWGWGDPTDPKPSGECSVWGVVGLNYLPVLVRWKCARPFPRWAQNKCGVGCVSRHVQVS